MKEIHKKILMFAKHVFSGGLKMNNWIPVEKELPQTYIFDRLWLSIQYPNGYSRTVEGRYDMYNNKFLHANQKPIKDKVTAWMEYRTPASYIAEEEEG